MPNNKKIKRKKNKKKTQNNYFENIKNNYKDCLSEEQIKSYEKMGEKMFNQIDFENNKTSNDLSLSPLEKSRIYIEEGLNSGLHPSYLENDEKQLMKELYGEKWYTKWNWDNDEEI